AKRSCSDTGTRVPLMVRFPDQRRAGETEKRVVQFVDFGATVLSLCGIKSDVRLDGVPFLGKHRRNGPGYAYSHSDRFDAVYDRQRSVSDGRYRYVRNYVTDLPYLIPNAYRERIPMTQDLYDLRGRTDLPASQWQMAATTRPVEEFYDSESDPWETANLIDSDSHKNRIAKMREALGAWMKDTKDLGFVLPESKLVREHIWPPQGKQPTTPRAEMHQAIGAIASVVTLSCAESGASIGYRVLPAKKGAAWSSYSKPFPVGEGQRIEVLTHRIGWRRNSTRFEVGPVPRAKVKPRGDAPNVVVIVADDLGFMDIGANNPNCLYDTPNIDRLSRSGLRFTDGYAACPVCSPTRYSLMTGRYPSRADATNYFMGRRAAKFKPALASNRMEIEERTIAEELGDRGYATFFAGKWHLGPTAEYWPRNQGFDVNAGGFHRGGPYGGKKYFSPYGNPRLTDGPDGEHLPDRLAQEACDFIDKNKDGSFLTYLSFYSVHTPLIGRKDLIEKYKKRIAALADGGAEFGPEEQSYNNGRERRVRLLQRHAVYAAMVEAMDQAVGKVLDKLTALGLDDNTIVVFTSDNGGLSTSEGSPTSNLPLRGGKGWMYEGGIREPWIWRVPGVTKAGATCNVPMSSVDLLPTVLELTGHAAVTQEIDGVSIASPLHAQPMAERPLFWHYPHYGNQGGFPSSAVRLGQWKLIERLEDGRVHLFDLSNDIGERNDLAQQQPERVAKLRDILHAWYRKMDAKFLREHKGLKPWQPPK
ncbi:MAG: arylsulfatase A-like enzyme, partial [Planctomycetota bacterium]